MAEDPKKTEEDEEKKEEKQEIPEIEERSVSKQFTGKFSGSKVGYTATAATHVFEIKEAKASFFYVAYTKDDPGPATRPVLFCFNGHLREFIETV